MIVMNYGSVRLAKSQLPDRDRDDGNMREHDWRFPLHIFLRSSQQRRLLFLLLAPGSCKSPRGLEHPCLRRGQTRCQQNWSAGPAGWPWVVSFARHCHQGEVLVCSKAQHLWGHRCHLPTLPSLRRLQGFVVMLEWFRAVALTLLMTHYLILKNNLPSPPLSSPVCKMEITPCHTSARCFDICEGKVQLENILLPSDSNRSSGQRLLLGYVYISFFPLTAEPLGLLWQEVLHCPYAFYKNKLLVLLTHRCFSISYSVFIWPASCLFVSYICFLQTKPVLFLLYFLVEGCNVFELFVINFWDSVTFVNQEGFFFFEVCRKN